MKDVIQHNILIFHAAMHVTISSGRRGGGGTK
jgi:hypothetical protein